MGIIFPHVHVLLSIMNIIFDTAMSKKNNNKSKFDQINLSADRVGEQA
jgi:hypothetical protein